MKRTITRILALSLCLLTLLAFVPAAPAFADEEPFPQNVTIQSQTNSAFDYLEYYNGSKWKDLNTPKHWIESTGQVCYCIEHGGVERVSPHYSGSFERPCLHNGRRAVSLE